VRKQAKRRTKREKKAGRFPVVFALSSGRESGRRSEKRDMGEKRLLMLRDGAAATTNTFYRTKSRRRYTGRLRSRAPKDKGRDQKKVGGKVLRWHNWPPEGREEESSRREGEGKPPGVLKMTLLER